MNKRVEGTGDALPDSLQSGRAGVCCRLVGKRKPKNDLIWFSITEPAANNFLDVIGIGLESLQDSPLVSQAGLSLRKPPLAGSLQQREPAVFIPRLPEKRGAREADADEEQQIETNNETTQIQEDKSACADRR